jgi:hypothetical protein
MASFRFLRAALLTLLLGASAVLAQATPSDAEDKLIDTLIQRVAKMGTMVFLRNGNEYNAADAAKHMQAKYDYFKKELATAEDFIERCASRSEMTGQALQGEAQQRRGARRQRVPERRAARAAPAGEEIERLNSPWP